MTTTTSQPDRRRLLVIGAVLVVVLAAVIAVVVAGGGGDDDAVGGPAPEATGEDFDGDAVTVGGEAAQVIAFVAHWCPHCQAEVPRIVEWIADGELPEDVPIRLVATGTDERQPNYPPSAWLEEEGWEGPVLVDSAESLVGEAFGVSAYPFFVAVDADGEVVARTSGELTLPQLKSLLATVER